jgi:hypothetical protein
MLTVFFYWVLKGSKLILNLWGLSGKLLESLWEPPGNLLGSL